MNAIECPKLCDDCPMRASIDGEPTLIGQLGYVVPGKIKEEDGRSVASFEFHRGIPDNYDERVSTIGISNETGRVGVRFSAPGKLLDDGTIAESLEKCEAPTEYRGGFLWLRRKLACTALKNLQTKPHSTSR